MSTKIEIFNQAQVKKEELDIRPGDVVRIHQKIKETAKKDKSSSGKKDKSAPANEQERIQVFEGVVLARKHGKGISATITVRKIMSGIGVEKIFPIHSPAIEKIEMVKRSKVRRAKLYYLRSAKGKKSRLKRKELVELLGNGEQKEKPAEEQKEKPSEKEQQ